MNCYDCYKAGAEEKAVGICHQCSAGLCGRHAVEGSAAVTTHALINRVVELPLKTRLLLCGACRDALAQRR